ncbi:DNA topoisomerase I [Candidatus Pacearchaeota archaeon]|nr:DNA topoisomerase I [Candidatus Pacearchaeota archaeon]
MPAKKPSQQQIEQKEYRIFNPETIKQTVEIQVKPKPTLDQIEKIEKIGKKPKPEKKLKDKGPAKQENKKLKSSGYSLIITEKPQAASKIAAALSNGKENKLSDSGIPYYELERNNKKIVVACAVGHLFTVSQTIKGTDYPIFDIGWFPNFDIKKRDFTRKYYNTINKLVKNASEIIIATDFDTEGEVIGYNIIRYIAGQKDARRMKFSSLTVKELQDAYDNSHPTIEWGQAIAGETRHFLDWLYGINLSRALMNSIKKTGKFKVMSIGRVQGPTLNLIVEKEKEIQKFKSTPYWQVFIEINDKKNKTELKYIKDLIKKQDLDKFNKLKGKTAIASTTKTKQTIQPPPPFDLTTLQTESYKMHGITPSQTLQIAQKLYLAGLISYPRTSSQKIPDTSEPKKVLEKLSKFFKETTKVTRSTPTEGKKSDPAHPSVMPTGNHEKLESQEEKIYNLIVKRFISCFCADAELENKKVEAIINISEMQISDDAQKSKKEKKISDNLKFNEKGMEIISPGWMDVYPSKMIEKEIKDFNGPVNIDNVRIEEKMTQPPKRYSPASILSELEKRSLGTKSTRANILDTLYERNYIKEKSIQATVLGIKLIDALKKYSEIIIDEKLTRELEKDMDIIRNSKKDLEKKQKTTIALAEESLKKISNDFKKNELAIGKELVDASSSMWEQQKEDNKLGIKCPNCNIGELTIKFTPRFKSYFIACSTYPDCKQTYPLPSKSLIKKLEDKKCDACNWPMLMSIKAGKRPWIFCFNPKCPKRQEKQDKEIINNTEDIETNK